MLRMLDVIDVLALLGAILVGQSWLYYKLEKSRKIVVFNAIPARVGPEFRLLNSSTNADHCFGFLGSSSLFHRRHEQPKQGHINLNKTIS
jgi:hypothetical protein